MKSAFLILILFSLLISCKDSSSNPSPASQSITAKQRDGDLNSYVNSYHAGLRLLGVSAKNIDIDGKALRREFWYVDTSAGEHPTYYFHVTESEIAFDSTAPELTGPSIITLGWLDSDSAIVFAESYGGTQYRAQNPDVTITGSLNQALVPNSVPTWRIIYQGGSPALGLIIDANSGALLGQTK